MAILMDSRSKVEQKLDYTHPDTYRDPLLEKWKLSKTPETYYWSSAAFYEEGIINFPFLDDYRSVF